MTMLLPYLNPYTNTSPKYHKRSCMILAASFPTNPIFFPVSIYILQANYSKLLTERYLCWDYFKPLWFTDLVPTFRNAFLSFLLLPSLILQILTELSRSSSGILSGSFPFLTQEETMLLFFCHILFGFVFSINTRMSGTQQVPHTFLLNAFKCNVCSSLLNCKLFKARSLLWSRLELLAHCLTRRSKSKIFIE